MPRYSDLCTGLVGRACDDDVVVVSYCVDGDSADRDRGFEVSLWRGEGIGITIDEDIRRTDGDNVVVYSGPLAWKNRLGANDKTTVRSSGDLRRGSLLNWS